MSKFFVMALACLIGTFFQAEASHESRELKAKQDIIEEDQEDTSSIFAIPLDDSNVEDEEELEAVKEKERALKHKS